MELSCSGTSCGEFGVDEAISVAAAILALPSNIVGITTLKIRRTNTQSVILEACELYLWHSNRGVVARQSQQYIESICAFQLLKRRNSFNEMNPGVIMPRNCGTGCLS